MFKNICSIDQTIFASDILIHQKTSDRLTEVFYGVSGGGNQGIMALDFWAIIPFNTELL
jgi:hypothetical protein